MSIEIEGLKGFELEIEGDFAFRFFFSFLPLDSQIAPPDSNILTSTSRTETPPAMIAVGLSGSGEWVSKEWWMRIEKFVRGQPELIVWCLASPTKNW